MKKSISIVLLATILLQSCVFYQKTSVSLNEAQNQGWVKVKNSYGNRFEFKNIYIEDSVYYGVHRPVDIRLDSGSISGIYLQDKKKSTWLTSFAVVAPIILILVIAGLNVIINGIS